MSTKGLLKKDKYQKARGGYSRLLQISCRKCKSSICVYQKDGSGNLRRMYIDRMHNQKVAITRKNLSCPNGHVLGVKMVYQKEKRPAFRLFVDAVTKKIMKI